ncbi:MAG: hypothetical protein AABW73_04595 [Nanoarchaeota archaeon]
MVTTPESTYRFLGRRDLHVIPSIAPRDTKMYMTGSVEAQEVKYDKEPDGSYTAQIVDGCNRSPPLKESKVVRNGPIEKLEAMLREVLIAEPPIRIRIIRERKGANSWNICVKS